MFFKLGIRPEQLPLFHPIWKSKLNGCCTAGDFQDKKEFNLHKILRAIDSNVILSKLTETDYCRTSMVPLKELLEKFSDHPKIIENTECIIAECNLNSNFKTYYTNSLENDMQLLTLQMRV
jgi:DNA polymerase-3 subunit alpha/error-prone DNA polymerase